MATEGNLLQLTPGEHVVQFYAGDEEFLDTLESFVAGAFEARESVVLFITAEHLDALEQRLRLRGIDLGAARAHDQLITEDAASTLERFLIGGWPSELALRQVVLPILQRARRNLPHVRVFGEMVALLWSQGSHGATMKLEELWKLLIREHRFAMLCAYPASEFSGVPAVQRENICCAHARELGASKN